MFVRTVVGAARRAVGEAHVGDDRRQEVAAARHAVRGVAGQREQPAVRPSVPRGVLDGAAGQSIRADAHAIVVLVAGRHNILELQGRVVIFHSREQRVPGCAADGQPQRWLPGNENPLAERHAHGDWLADAIALLAGTSQDPRRSGRARRHAVHFLRGLVRAVGAIRLVRGAGVIDDRAAGERVGGNVHAVVVAISVHDGVAEGQGVGGVVFRRKPGGARDGAPGTAQFQFQHRALQIHDLATNRPHFEHVRRFAEDHLHFNGLAGRVGVADLRRGCDAQALDGWRLIVVAGIHFVRRVLGHGSQATGLLSEIVAGAVFDPATHQRVRANADAV